MKSDWKTVRLGDVCSIRRGASPRPIHAFIQPSEEGGIPWVKIADANATDSRYIYRTNESIIPEGERCSLSVVPGDLIVSNSATPGLPRIIQIKACIHDGWLLLRDFNEVERDFLFYKFLDIRPSLLNHANGSVFQNLKTDIVKEYQISLPPLPIQRKIAAVLGSIDDKIENNRKICVNLEAQAQALFKSWFVDDAKNIVKTKQVQEVFDVTIGRTPPRKEFEWFSEDRTNNVVWVSIADMGTCGTFISDSAEYLTQDAITRFKFRLVPRGTVLLSFKLTVGRVAIANEDLTTNEAIAQLRTDDCRMREYLYCYLKQFDFDTLGSTSSIATAVNSTTIKEMPFLVPNELVLDEFHNRVSPLFDIIRVSLSETERLAEMRDALLPKLMSGEIDVDKVEI